MRARHYLYYFVYLAAVVVLSLVIVLAFRSHTGENTSHVKKPAVAQAPVTQPNQASSSNSSSSSSSSSASSHSTSQTAPAQLTNTGPGSLTVVFAVAGVAGTAGYRYYLVKKAQA